MVVVKLRGNLCTIEISVTVQFLLLDCIREHSSTVERQLPKLNVAGSNPVVRSTPERCNNKFRFVFVGFHFPNNVLSVHLSGFIPTSRLLFSCLHCLKKIRCSERICLVNSPCLQGFEFKVDGDHIDVSYTYDSVPFERIRRITGYLVGTLDRFNDAKRAEVEDRVKHNIGETVDIDELN